MKANEDLKSVLWNRLSRFNIDDNKKNQLVAELDVLSNLIIDSYLEYNKGYHTPGQAPDSVPMNRNKLPR